ncbi:hypothetical protein [Pseudonocardia acaciae]|uniref:hypothetical protein n=1 Tax=Pseudonocardia acaciae TaxID=551276 RepID=UPI00048EAA12|nr:hypothetical protein [Pseudonocardia acaciae]
MFRRRRGSSRPPAASAWWPVSPEREPEPEPSEPSEPDVRAEHRRPSRPDSDRTGSGRPDQAPPLPADDPFGGWPAFGPGDPTEAVLGQPDPMSAWAAPNGTARGPAPAGAPGSTTTHGPPTGHGPPGGPGANPGAGPGAGRPAAPRTRSAPGEREPTAPPPAGPGGTGQSGSEWLPLLTHADDDQRFQAGADQREQAAAPPRNGRPRTKRRAARTARAPRDRRPEPPPPPPAPRPDPVPDATSVAATTWLDPVGPPHPMEAAALAGAFAADYLSWDEQAPERRGQVLAQYLPSDVVGNAALLGWSGKGRQRAEFALPGAVRPDGDGRVVVDVRVRVTPYRAVGQPSAPAPAGDLEVAGVPAVAPAPTARGWKSLDSYWVRLSVPVNRDQGRLVVDTWDEQLGEEPAPDPASKPPAPTERDADPATAEDLDDADDNDTNGQAPPAEPAEETAAAASPPASSRPGKPGRSGERGRPGAPTAPTGGSR